MENLQKMNLKGDAIFEKMKETTLDVPAPMSRKDPRRRLSAQFSSSNDLIKGMQLQQPAPSSGKDSVCLCFCFCFVFALLHFLLADLSLPRARDQEEAAMRNPSRNLRLSTYVGDAVVMKINLPENLKTTVEVRWVTLLFPNEGLINSLTMFPRYQRT